jgi:hypothetical protein
MRSTGAKLAVMVVVLLVGGCALGYNSALFITRSNVGIDIESTPPTAEISISRQEGVIAPVFEGGQTPPLLAGFATGSEGLLRIPFGGRSVFAGGDAAVALSNKKVAGPAHNATEKDSVLCLSMKPDKDPEPRCSPGIVDKSIPGPGKIKPVLLATDTTFGAKIAWSGATSTIPDSLVVGYNRKEIALAPVFESNQVDCQLPGNKTKKGEYGVWLPSFLALLDTRLGVGSPADSNFSYCQMIATGQSATNLGKNEELQKMVLEIAMGRSRRPEKDK